MERSRRRILLVYVLPRYRRPRRLYDVSLVHRHGAGSDKRFLFYDSSSTFSPSAASPTTSTITSGGASALSASAVAAPSLPSSTRRSAHDASASGLASVASACTDDFDCEHVVRHALHARSDRHSRHRHEHLPQPRCGQGRGLHSMASVVVHQRPTRKSMRIRVFVRPERRTRRQRRCTLAQVWWLRPTGRTRTLRDSQPTYGIRRNGPAPRHGHTGQCPRGNVRHVLGTGTDCSPHSAQTSRVDSRTRRLL